MPGTALGVKVSPEKEKGLLSSTYILDRETVPLPTIKKVTSDGNVTVRQGHVTESKGAVFEGLVREGLPEEVAFELRAEG